MRSIVVLPLCGLILAGCGGGSAVTTQSAPSQIVLRRLAIPEPIPAFEFDPEANYNPGGERTVVYEWEGDSEQRLPRSADIADDTDVYVALEGGTLQPSSNKIAISGQFRGENAAKNSYSVVIGEDATVRTRGATAVDIGLDDNEGDVVLVNRGTIEIQLEHDSVTLGLRGHSHTGTGNARSVNYGTIRATGSLAPHPEGQNLKGRMVLAGIGKLAAPFTTEHVAEAINMPGGKIIVTGEHNHRMDGLHVETGSGHLSRLINYGEIELEGTKSRGLSAQTLWGATQSHNLGTITVTGNATYGIYTGTCAAWTNKDGCDGRQQVLRPEGSDLGNTPGAAFSRNYAAGVIKANGRNSAGIRSRSQRSGRVYAINEGRIETTGDNAYGISVEGFSGIGDRFLLNPDTTDHDFVYAFNSGSITTNGASSHGILARHKRGGEVYVENTGTIAVSRDGAAGILAGSYGVEVNVEMCGEPYQMDENDNPIPNPQTECSRTTKDGTVTVINDGTVTATGTDAEGNGTGIGIDVNPVFSKRRDTDPDFTVGGDVVIASNGSIRASHIGIRARTSTDSTITLHVTGTLEAPIPVMIEGGNDGNQIILPPIQQATTALGRMQEGFAGSPGRVAPPAGRGFIPLVGNDALGVGFLDRSRFVQVELIPPSGGYERGGVSGWRARAGFEFALGDVAVRPRVLLASGLARASVPYVKSRRRIRQHGFALRIGGDGAWVDLSWSRLMTQTETRVRVPGFALDIDEPAQTVERFRVEAGYALGGGALLCTHWRADDTPWSRMSHRVGLELSVPLPPYGLPKG